MLGTATKGQSASRHLSRRLHRPAYHRPVTDPRRIPYGFGAAALAWLWDSRSTSYCGAISASAACDAEPVAVQRDWLGMLSPIGLSVTTKLAPEVFRAQMMALLRAAQRIRLLRDYRGRRSWRVAKS